MAEDVTFEDLEGMTINYYFTLIAFTLLAYDYCLTFVAEVERFWGVSRLNWASTLFYLNRYLSLFGHIPVMMEFFWSSSSPGKIQVCHALQSYHQYLAIVIQLVIACMMVMRIYALYERSRRVLALHVGVVIIAVVIGCWAVLGGKSEKAPDILFPIGCGSALTHEQGTRLGAAWAGMLVFDALVFGMTLYKALSIPRMKGITLLSVLLRDGTIYFCVMMASNLGNILTFVFGGPFTRGVATTFTNIISSIMISRLMLNLRDPSLVSHPNRSSLLTTEDTTCPNLTFVEATYDTEFSDGGGIISQPQAGRARLVYDYLAEGSSRKNKDQDMELLERGRPQL